MNSKSIKIIMEGAKCKGDFFFHLSLLFVCFRRKIILISIFFCWLIVVKFSVSVYCNLVIDNMIDYTEIFKTAEKRTSTKKIVVHNTAINQDSIGLLKIHEYHKFGDGKGNGGFAPQSGFAYSYFIMKGKIYKIHDEEDATAHALNYNHSTLGFCFQGDFNKIKPTFKEYLLGAILCEYLIEKYNLNINDILGHRDLNNTDCPGLNFSIEKLRLFVKILRLIKL